MHHRERYFIPAYGPDDTAFQSLFQHAIATATRLGIRRLTFVAHGLQNNGWLERAFGHDAVKRLRAGIGIQNTNITAFFESLKTYQSQDPELLFTLGLRSDDILLLEDEYGIAAIHALQWNHHELDKWAQISRAINILDGTPMADIAEPPCVITKALGELSETINMGTGLGHPSDDHLAKTFLRALHKYGFALDELSIEAFLLHRGWTKRHADELLSIIRKINQGKTFQGGDKTYLKEHITRWEKQCKA